jgi:hypothetical protein
LSCFPVLLPPLATHAQSCIIIHALFPISKQFKNKRICGCLLACNMPVFVCAHACMHGEDLMLFCSSMKGTYIRFILLRTNPQKLAEVYACTIHTLICSLPKVDDLIPLFLAAFRFLREDSFVDEEGIVCFSVMILQIMHWRTYFFNTYFEPCGQSH